MLTVLGDVGLHQPLHARRALDGGECVHLLAAVVGIEADEQGVGIRDEVPVFAGLHL